MKKGEYKNGGIWTKKKYKHRRNIKKLTINFEKTNEILFLNSSNVQNYCPNVFIKLGETTRKNERIKKTDLVRFLGIWLDTKF